MSSAPTGPTGPTIQPPSPSAPPRPGIFSPPPPYTGPAPTGDDRTMGMLCHLLAIFTWFLGPVIIWAIKKDSSPFVNDQGKEALNFQITILIAYAVVIVGRIFMHGLPLMTVVWALHLIFCIMGTVKASNGEAYRYPISIRFIR